MTIRLTCEIDVPDWLAERWNPSSRDDTWESHIYDALTNYFNADLTRVEVIPNRPFTSQS